MRKAWKEINETNVSPMTPKPEANEIPIPVEIRKWIKEKSEEYVDIPKKVSIMPDRNNWADSQEDYCAGAEDMYRHLQSSKGKGTQWCEVKNGLPEEGEYYVKVYNPRLGYTIQRIAILNMDKTWIIREWEGGEVVYEWLDEQGQSNSRIAEGELERVRAENDEYRKILVRLNDNSPYENSGISWLSPSIRESIASAIAKYK